MNELEITVPKHLVAQATSMAHRLGSTPKELILQAITVGMHKVCSSMRGPTVSTYGPRRRAGRGRPPLPWISRSSPARVAKEQSRTKPCYSCSRKRPFDGGLHCPSCRWRASNHGWCGCGTALYSDGLCYTGVSKHIRHHRDHVRELAQAEAARSTRDCEDVA